MCDKVEHTQSSWDFKIQIKFHMKSAHCLNIQYPFEYAIFRMKGIASNWSTAGDVFFLEFIRLTQSLLIKKKNTLPWNDQSRAVAQWMFIFLLLLATPSKKDEHP